MNGLLGPNGAGKSTLMRILATLQEPASGTATLDDLSGTGQTIDVVNEKDEVRKTLGYLPQEFGVYPKVSAEELLEHFALLKGIAVRRARKDVVEALLRQTNLWKVRKQKLAGYSGGMKQRFGVVVAQAYLPDFEREHATITTKLLAGQTVARVYSDTAPGAAFEAVEPDLEDVYFGTMAGHLGRRPSAALRAGRAGGEQPEPAVAP